MSAWLTVPEGKHCAAHGETFMLGEVCSGCVANPSPIEVTSESCGNVHDDELARREAFALATVETILPLAVAEIEAPEGDWHRAAKVMGEAGKLLRLANELRETRARRDHIRMLRETALKMAGNRGHN